MIGRPWSNRLGRSSLFVLAAEVGLQGTRAATTIVLFRILGDAEFGRYAGLLAASVLLSSASQMGMNHVSVRAVAHGRPFGPTVDRLLVSVIGGGLLGTAVVVAVGVTLVDVPVPVAARVAVAQLVGAGGAAGITLLCEARQRADVGLRIGVAGMVLRMTALGGFVIVGREDIVTWSWFLMAAMLIWLCFSVVQLARVFDVRPRLALPAADELRTGSSFVVLQTAGVAHTNVDRLMLNGYGLPADAGIYSPAFRIAQLCILPVTALVRATYADFFRLGSSDPASQLARTRRLNAIAVGLGLAAGVGLLLLAPVAGWITGDDRVVTIVRWLAPLPLLKGMQYFPGNLLSGMERTGRRSLVMVAAAVLNGGLNLALIPLAGWRAAVGATLITEAIQVLALWWMAKRSVGSADAEVATETVDIRSSPDTGQV